MSAILVFTQAHLCFDVLHSTAHTHGLAANFTNIAITTREMTVNTLRKVNPVKPTLSNTLFIYITKSNQDLV
jgi:hypothetical protein